MGIINFITLWKQPDERQNNIMKWAKNGENSKITNVCTGAPWE